MSPAGSLVQEVKFETGDPDVAREFLNEAFGHEQFTVDQPIVDDRLLSIRRFDAPRMNLSRIGAPSEMEMAVTGVDDEVMIGMLLEGTAIVDRRGSFGEGESHHGPGDVMLVNDLGAEWHWHTQPHTDATVGISCELLRKVGNTGGGGDADTKVGFRSSRPIQGRESLWRSATAQLDTVLGDPNTAAAPLVVGLVEQMVAATALTVFPNDLVTDDAGSSGDARTETFRRAKAFIDANPEMNMTVDDVAAAAHTTQRGVQMAFRRHLDTTPMTYLRTVRLEYARKELTAGRRGEGIRVIDVAARWGFASPSRFAAFYREQFGELPKETLERGD